MSVMLTTIQIPRPIPILDSRKQSVHRRQELCRALRQQDAHRLLQLPLRVQRPEWNTLQLDVARRERHPRHQQHVNLWQRQRNRIVIRAWRGQGGLWWRAERLAQFCRRKGRGAAQCGALGAAAAAGVRGPVMSGRTGLVMRVHGASNAALWRLDNWRTKLVTRRN
jgi:hypothetical protein